MAKTRPPKIILTTRHPPPYGGGGGGDERAGPAPGAGSVGPAPHHPLKTVNFSFQPKYRGEPLKVTINFNGTKREAYNRAHALASGLVDLLADRQFTVRVDRTDRPSAGYEIDASGHTVDA